MSLLAPAGLAALLLLPVVLLIHLWRVRYRRHTLPSTLLWSRVLSESPLRRPRRLPTRYILLLLELATLLCGGLALARPAFVAAGTTRHLLVAVDTSLLTTADDTPPNRLARARELVSPLIDGLAARDSMTLVDAGTTPRALITSSDHAALRRALDALTPGDGPSSLDEDGALLAGLAMGGGAHTTAYLFAPLGTGARRLTPRRAGAARAHGRDDERRPRRGQPERVVPGGTNAWRRWRRQHERVRGLRAAGQYSCRPYHDARDGQRRRPERHTNHDAGGERVATDQPAPAGGRA